MLSTDGWEEQWRKERSALPFHAAMEMTEEGVVFGCGTVLAPLHADNLDHRNPMIKKDDERVRALLFATYGMPVPLDITKYISRASRQWRRGEKALANIELAFARLPRLDRREDAFRLFLAEKLLDHVFSPRGLMEELGLDPDTNTFRKNYHPNQPRVPQGTLMADDGLRGNSGSRMHRCWQETPMAADRWEIEKRQ